VAIENVQIAALQLPVSQKDIDLLVNSKKRHSPGARNSSGLLFCLLNHW